MILQKPWGKEEIWAKTKDYVGKIIYIDKGKRLSYQYHEKKVETIRMLRGSMELQIDSDDFHLLTEGDIFHINCKVPHRMSAISDCEVLEVSTPELDDVVRLIDDYGRVK